jgi:hypothetical protein
MSNDRVREGPKGPAAAGYALPTNPRPEDGGRYIRAATVDSISKRRPSEYTYQRRSRRRQQVVQVSHPRREGKLGQMR